MPPGLLGTFLLLSFWGCDSSQLCIQHQVRAALRPRGASPCLAQGAALREPCGWNQSSGSLWAEALGSPGGLLGSSVPPETLASRQELSLSSTEKTNRSEAEAALQPEQMNTPGTVLEEKG